MGNIRDRDTVAERLWDWEFLNGAFPGKIRPMDVDGLVERNGSFLVLEGKPLDKDIPLGQKITLDQLAQKQDTYVLVLYGEPGCPQKMELLGYHSRPVECQKSDVVRLVRRWAEHAEDKR